MPRSLGETRLTDCCWSGFVAVFLSRLTGCRLSQAGHRRLDGPARSHFGKDGTGGGVRVPVAATEENSRTTWENAFDDGRAFTARLHIGRFLVTHAMHMQDRWRCSDVPKLMSLRRPTAFLHADDSSILSPTGPMLNQSSSYFALHELPGGAWYALRQRWRVYSVDGETTANGRFKKVDLPATNSVVVQTSVLDPSIIWIYYPYQRGAPAIDVA